MAALATAEPTGTSRNVDVRLADVAAAAATAAEPAAAAVTAVRIGAAAAAATAAELTETSLITGSSPGATAVEPAGGLPARAAKAAATAAGPGTTEADRSSGPPWAILLVKVTP